MAHPLVGNPLLKPETSESSEVTLHVRANKATTLSLTGFSNEFRNLIDFDPILFKNVNRSKVRTNGGEISISSTPVESLAVNLYTTYTDFSVVDGDADFTGRPKVVAGILANWLITANWQATTDYQWSDSRMAGTLHRGSAELVELSSRELAHFSVRWQAQPRLALALAIDNLFDKAYEEAVGQPSPGRTFRLEMTYGK
jgi:vitamin B12 transporter